MPTSLKTKGIVLTSTLTNIFTANASTKISHLTFCNGATAGSITLKWKNTTTQYFRLNAVAIAANEVVEYADINLEETFELYASAAISTDVNLSIDYTEYS